MRVKITRVDKSLPLPQYHTEGAVAFDLYARVETKIAAGAMTKIPVNVIIQVPKGNVCIVAARSSTPFKQGLMLANGIGIVDQDYYGADDEFMVPVYNVAGKKVTIERGERFAQAMFLPVESARWVETSKPGRKSRGGFGSTGHK